MWAGHVKCMDTNKQSIRSLIGMENGMKSLGSVGDNIQNIFGKMYVCKDKNWTELDCAVINLSTFILTLTSWLRSYS
jgi:hypothetical protein